MCISQKIIVTTILLFLNRPITAMHQCNTYRELGKSLHASKWIENYYWYAPKHDPLAKLIRNLWFCRNEGEQFLPTKRGASTILRKSVFGQLMDALYTGKILDEDAMFGKKIFKPNKRDFSYAGGWVNQLSKQFPKKFKVGHMRALIRKINDSVEISKKEQDFPYKTEAILWAFFLATHKKSEKIINSYKPTDYLQFEEEVKTLNAKEQIDYILKQYDRAMHSLITRADMKKLPPPVIQGNYGYQGAEPFETCTGSTMLDVFSILSYHPKKERYDHTLLPPDARNGLGCKQLFAVLQSPHQINNRDIGQIWMNLISGRNYLYAKTVCDTNAGYILRPRVTNIINLFNFFYGTKATTIEEFGDLLSHENRKLVFTKQKENSNNNNIITIHIESKTLDISYDLEIVLQPFHAYLQCKERNIKSIGVYKPAVPQLLVQRIIKTKQLYPYMQILTLLASNQILTNIDHTQWEEKSFIRNIIRHLYYSFALKFPKVKLAVIKDALERRSDLLDDNLMQLIYQLAKKVPTGDYYLPHLCKTIIRSEIYKKDIFFKKFLLSHPSEALNMAPYAHPDDSLQLCRWLLKNGADINWQDYEQKEYSVLMIAVQEEQIKLIQFLLNQPAITINAYDEDKKTALDHAKNKTIRELLKKSGAKSGL